MYGDPAAGGSDFCEVARARRPTSFAMRPGDAGASYLARHHSGRRTRVKSQARDGVTPDPFFQGIKSSMPVVHGTATSQFLVHCK